MDWFDLIRRSDGSKANDSPLTLEQAEAEAARLNSIGDPAYISPNYDTVVHDA